MKLQPAIQACLEKNGYLEPTKIQEDVINLALAGKNIVGQSQTGTGKTAAFVLPLLELIDTRIRRPQAVILAPTRELATQIRDEVLKLSEGMFLRSTVVFGGTSIRKQREIIEKGPQIIIATPGRLIDLIDKGYIDLAQVKYFVLDEVDRMLDMGFVDDIDYIWGNLPKIEQSMTFSATIPQEMKNLLTKYVGEGYEFIKSTDELTVDKIDHSFIEVETFDKFNLLKDYIVAHDKQKIIVFSRTKFETEHLARVLQDNGVSAEYLHGDMEQRDRTRALRRFKEDEVQVFVTTDVAARGLNMNNIELVVNYHVPEDPEAYIHRIGRTGRAGASGKAIMFVAPTEKLLLKNIEKRNKIRIKQIDINGTEIVRAVEEERTGFGGRGRGRGRSGGGGGGYGRGGGYRGSSGGGSGYHGSHSSSAGAPKYNPSSEGAPERSEFGGGRSGGYAGHSAAPSTGGYQGGRSSSGGYQGSGTGSRGGYQGHAPSSGGGYQGERSSGRGYEGSSPRAERSPNYGNDRPHRAPQGGGEFSVFGG